jgi:integrase
MPGLNSGEQISVKRVSRIISAIGKRANVVVNHAKKSGSDHDLRRAFGTRWAHKVKPATLQLLMRHESIETTLKYYVAQDADDIADELRRQYDPKKGSSTSPGEANPVDQAATASTASKDANS